jgi:predicted Rossmann fold nucleotide-binding protein DprA/Smf involved in DNA uptake
VATRDRFGNQIGTMASRVNDQLTAEPKTVERISQESHARKGSTRSQLYRLYVAGKIKRVETSMGYGYYIGPATETEKKGG